METFIPPQGSYTRPLTTSEQRLMRAALAFREGRVRSALSRYLKAFLLIFGSLWLLTLLVSRFSSTKMSWQVATALWAVIGTAIFLWSYLPESRRERAGLRAYQETVEQDQAVVMRIASKQMVEFEEEEDEGACYAFQLNDDQIIFVSGQDFYPAARFPSNDFSLVHIVSPDGALVEMLVEKHGEKLTPMRTIPAQVKAGLEIPGHLEIVRGKLEELESLLAPSETEERS